MNELPALDWRMLAFVLAAGMAVAAAWFAGRASTRRPLRAFGHAVGSWHLGDLQAPIGVSSPQTPLGPVSAAFDDMAARLSRREAEREEVLGALREGEERLQIALDVAGLGVWDWDHATGEIAWSDQMFRLTGLDPGAHEADPFGAWLGVLHPDDRDRVEADVKQLPQTMNPLAAEYRIVRPDGSVRWLQMRGQSLAAGTGRPLRTVIVNLDITPSKEDEIRERFLLSLSDQIRDLARPDEILMTVAEALGRHLGVTRLGYGEIDHASMVLSTLADWHTDEMPDVVGRHPLAPFGPFLCDEMRAGRIFVIDDALTDPRVREFADVYAALQNPAVITVSLVKEGQLRAALYVHNKTARHWTPGEIELCRDVAERTWSAVERARSDARQRLLINELNHRVKNALATVQSIAAHSFKLDEPQAGRAAFESRLFALSRTHDVLTRRNWEGANLRDIVEEALAPYRRHGAERVRIEGDPLQLPPRVALPIAMALHELATNAAKYGAFSTEAGSATIRWTISDEASSPYLTLEWQEAGGPPVRTPEHKGFGTRLIERSLTRELGAEATLDYRPDGLVCAFRFPLPEAETVDYAEANARAALLREQQAVSPDPDRG